MVTCLIPQSARAHGLAAAEVKRAEAAVKEVVAQIERERKSGQHRYRDLPPDRDMLQGRAGRGPAPSGGKFENLVVLGIGGSALGNIALQTALNPPYHNLLPAGCAAGRGCS